jgi:hypothetical protein
LEAVFREMAAKSPAKPELSIEEETKKKEELNGEGGRRSG